MGLEAKFHFYICILKLEAATVSTQYRRFASGKGFPIEMSYRILCLFVICFRRDRLKIFLAHVIHVQRFGLIFLKKASRRIEKFSTLLRAYGRSM